MCDVKLVVGLLVVVCGVELVFGLLLVVCDSGVTVVEFPSKQVTHFQCLKSRMYLMFPFPSTQK